MAVNVLFNQEKGMYVGSMGEPWEIHGGIMWIHLRFMGDPWGCIFSSKINFGSKYFGIVIFMGRGVQQIFSPKILVQKIFIFESVTYMGVERRK